MGSDVRLETRIDSMNRAGSVFPGTHRAQGRGLGMLTAIPSISALGVGFVTTRNLNEHFPEPQVYVNAPTDRCF